MTQETERAPPDAGSNDGDGSGEEWSPGTYAHSF